MSARSRAASWAQKRAIANPFQAEMPTSPPKQFGGLADPLDQRLVAGHDQRRADGDAAFGNRRPRELLRRYRRRAGWFRQTPACRRGAAASGRRIRRAASVSPIAARPNTTISQSRSEASSARSISIRRAMPRAVEQDGLLRQPGEMRAGRGLQGDVELRRPARRAVDLFGRRRRQRQPRALAGRDLDVKTVAAGDAAGGVDEHGRQPLVLRRGKPHAERAGFMQDRRGG